MAHCVSGALSAGFAAGWLTSDRVRVEDATVSTRGDIVWVVLNGRVTR